MGKQGRTGTIGARQIGGSMGRSIATTLGASPQVAKTVGKLAGSAAQYARNAFRNITGFEDGGLATYGKNIIVVDPYTNRRGKQVRRTFRNKKTNDPKLKIGEMRTIMEPHMAEIKQKFLAKLRTGGTATKRTRTKKVKVKLVNNKRFNAKMGKVFNKQLQQMQGIV